MPVIAVAVCPHPPLLIPKIAAGAAGELDDLRRACDAAIGRLARVGADTLVLIGAGERTGSLPVDSYASFAPFGVSIEISLDGGKPEGPKLEGGRPEGPKLEGGRLEGGKLGGGEPGDGKCAGGPRLPLSLAVGTWLLTRQPRRPAVEAISVTGDAGAGECAALGSALAHRPDRVALLVMGDGSARRGEGAPGYGDARAQPYDDRVARALADADAATLAALDPVLSAELLVAGHAPWRVLAHAVRAGGGPWRGDVSYYAAPYGVAYFVATWEPAPRAGTGTAGTGTAGTETDGVGTAGTVGVGAAGTTARTTARTAARGSA